MKKRTGLQLLPALLLPIALSAHAFFCPTGFGQINFGNSMDQVIAQCGKPDTQKKIRVSNEDSLPQEWIYNETLQGAGALRVSIMMVDKKVINLTVNGMNMTTTNLCNGNSVSLGDSIDSVKRACGPPVLVTKNQPVQNDNAGENAEDAKDFKKGTVEFHYNSTTPVTLVFENGLLKEKR